MSRLPKPVSRWKPTIAVRGPRYLAVVDAIAEGVANGQLYRGDRLPTMRQLAGMMELNLATVSRGIAEAERRGLVRAQQGRGTFIADDPATVTDDLLDLTLNIPPEPPGSPLARSLRETTARVLAGDGGMRMLRYPDLGGSAADRSAGARWLTRRGIQVAPGQVVMTDGADHAILLALMALAPRGGRVLVEDLTYPGIVSMAALLRLEVAGVPRDDDGMVPDRLERELRSGPGLLFLTPTLHNPTTATMSIARREAIVALCRRYDAHIIEDDVYGYFPVEAPAPFAVLAPERTAYLTSFSKCFAPGLRIGYLAAASAALADRLGATARATTCTPAAIAAAVASRWIDDGIADEALASTRAELARRDELCSRILPDDLQGQAAQSPHRWLNLPAGWHRAEFIERARLHGVMLRGSDPFTVDRPPPEAVRFSISAPADLAALERGLLVLARTLREQHGPRRAVV
jgi:DNA-binding transcriptional MocR family regulator